MLYAVVDIETTGGHASSNGITEIAVFVYDGASVVEHYETLINPDCPIPGFITGLTGITNDMVKDAPYFWEVADRIFNLLNGNVFVAHNVNFDYSFVKNELAKCGYELNAKKLCTVRMSRKVFPGYKSYSLGNICGYLGISIDNRHRAGGDALATVRLLEQILGNDSGNIVPKSLKKTSREQSLPPNVSRAHYEQLPDMPGVYYFLDQRGKVLYVGKAKNLKKRVGSHFSNNSTSRQKQDFMREIYGISYEVCGNELIALLLESHEIKRLWPKFNRSQKRYEPRFGIIHYTDQRGIQRLAIQKLRQNISASVYFDTMIECLSALRQTAESYELCPRLSGIAIAEESCDNEKCACRKGDKKVIAQYNIKVTDAVTALTAQESYVIVEEGRHKDESACVVVENGQFTGMGYMPREALEACKLTLEDFRNISLYRENFNIRAIVSKYREEHPERVISFA
jgi:DNA polymerase-3 subunit epsilon